MFYTGIDTETAQEVVDSLIRNCWNFRKPETAEDKKKLVESWQKALDGYIYPPYVYIDAVSSWLSKAKAGDAPPYPGDILHHCVLVVDKIESDPARRPALEKYRRDYARWRGEMLSGNAE